MITKDLIVKSLNDAITKCGQKLTLTKTVKGIFNNFAKETRKRTTEKAILVDDKGKILKSKNGNKDGVSIGNEVLDAFEKNNHEPLHIDHNHPNAFEDDAPSFLSVVDMDWVVAQHPDTDEFLVKSISCEDCYNHSRMTIVRGDNYKSSDKDAFEKARDFLWNNVGIETLLTHFSKTQRNFKKLWDEIPVKPKVGSHEYEDLLMDKRIEANNITLEEEGFFDEIKSAQDLFKEANCRLSLEWVYD